MADRPSTPPDLRWVAVAVAAAGLGAVALASRGSGIFGRLEDGTSPFGTTVARAALGAVLGAGAAFGIVALVRATNPRHRLVDPGPVAPRWRRALRWALPLIVLLSALGAAAGAATSPLRPREPATPSSPTSATGASARYVDLDGDGQPDRDADGRRIVAVDMGGDGDYDAVLRPCPNSAVPRTGEVDPSGSGDERTILIDQDCDGEIDYRVPLRDGLVNDLGSTSSRPSPEPQAGSGARQPSVDRSPDVAGAVRTVSILLLAAGVIAAVFLVWRALRDRARSKRRDVEPLPPAAEGPEEVDRSAAAASVEDAIAAMLADRDPRTAIRAAYATLLDGLAAAGLARLPYEAPAEHLERCLTQLSVRPAPMRLLVEVFSLARFSSHPILESHRADALGALRAAQQDLATARHPDDLVGAGAP